MPSDEPSSAAANRPAAVSDGPDDPGGAEGHGRSAFCPGRSVSGSSLRSLRFGMWVVALLLGAIDACYRPFAMSPMGPFEDTVSYLNLAAASARGDWAHALNAYWSPLYSWILALAFRLLHPGVAAEFAVVHGVNLIIFAGALGSFEYFWRAWMEDHQARGAAGREGWISLPPWALLVIGYAVFTWSSIRLIGIQLGSPDLLVAALVYLAAGLTLRLRRGGAPLGNPVLASPFMFGAVLGLGFLAKAAMLPMALVFLLVAFRPLRDPRCGVLGLLLAGIAFMLVAGPFVAALSLKEGHLTFGDTGRLNYAWFVNRVALRNWQGEPPGSGEPKHPTQLLYPHPPVYAFAGPIGGAYPLWTDPAYWNKGLRAHFNGPQQVRALLRSLKRYRRRFLWNEQSGLVAAIGLLLLLSVFAAPREWPSQVRWDLLLICGAPVVLYGLVIVESRYLGAYVTLFWLAFLSAVRMPANKSSKVCSAAAVAVMLLPLGFGLAHGTARDLLHRSAGDADWDAATRLKRMGIQPGDRVGCIGFTWDHGWAEMAQVTVVAEIPSGHGDGYWRADPGVRAAVLRAFARTGARAVLTDQPPAGRAASGWRRVGSTSRYIYWLAPVPERSLASLR